MIACVAANLFSKLWVSTWLRMRLSANVSLLTFIRRHDSWLVQQFMSFSKARFSVAALICLIVSQFSTVAFLFSETLASILYRSATLWSKLVLHQTRPANSQTL